MRIQKYLRPHLAYTNRIRPSTRIRFVSGHLKGLVNRAWKISRGKRLVLILWRQRIQKYTDTSVHTYPDTQRIQKFPLWRAYTEISGYTERIRRTRVDARCIRIKKFADTKISGYVWTGPNKLKQRRLWATHVNRKWPFFILERYFCQFFWQIVSIMRKRQFGIVNLF